MAQRQDASNVSTPSVPDTSHPSFDLHLQPVDLLALYAAVDLDGFIEQTFRLLPKAVPCEYVSAFYQHVGDGFLVERDSRGRIWDRAFMRRYVELTPAIALVTVNPGVRLLATRFHLPSSEVVLHRMPFYREVMQPQGWRHGVSLCFWAAPSASFPTFVLSLYRPEGRPDFSDQELAILAGLHSFLAPAVVRLQKLSASDAVSEGIAAALAHASPGLVVLDCELRIVRATVDGQRLCAEWSRASTRRCDEQSDNGWSVPGCLLQVCQELRRELTTEMERHGAANARQRRTVVHPQSPALSASVTVVCLAGAFTEASFVIEFQTRGRRDGSAATASLLTQLTRAETEVALVVAEGLSNEEVAERLGKTIHAVKFLLHKAFQKLGVPNRARLGLLLRDDAPRR